MNTVIEELFARKSVRKYLEQPIEMDKQELILNAALQAPTAGNMTLYSIINVTDSEKKQKLSISCDNQPFIANAPMVLIFCADYRRWYDAFCLYESEVRKPATGDFLLAIQDTMIAAQNAVVAAESLGIGSCYIGDIMEHYEYHKELLNLPKYVAPIAMLCLGYPTEQQASRQKPSRFAKEYIVHENTYAQTSAVDLKEMLKRGEDWNEEQLENWTRAFCKRKWNSDFSVEMSRSAAEIVKDWNV